MKHSFILCYSYLYKSNKSELRIFEFENEWLNLTDFPL